MNTTTENKTTKRGRPVVANSARQTKLAVRAERMENGGSIERGRPSNPNSKRQMRLAAQEARKAAGKTGDDIYPYKYGVIDTIDKLEEYAVISATEKYKSSVIGSKFTGDSVIDLPMGAGWGLVREELLLRVGQLSEYFRHLIIISHVKDKYLDGKDSKDGNQVSILDLSLSGKLGAILSAKVDAIGYLYRGSKSKDEPYGQLMVSFATNDKSVMGSRYKHLAGKTVPFSWDTIFTPTPPQV
jgi:hypothetical protein